MVFVSGLSTDCCVSVVPSRILHSLLSPNSCGVIGEGPVKVSVPLFICFGVCLGWWSCHCEPRQRKNSEYFT